MKEFHQNYTRYEYAIMVTLSYISIACHSFSGIAVLQHDIFLGGWPLSCNLYAID